MVKISVEVSNAEMMAFELTGEDPQKWLQKAIKDRARIAMEYIAGIYRSIAQKDDDVSIPTSLEAIVNDAFERDWLVE